MNKRIISVMLLVVMIFSNTLAFAGDISGIIDFEKLRQSLRTQKSDFSSPVHVEQYRLRYLSDIFPRENVIGDPIDHNEVLSVTGVWKYGGRQLVLDRGDQSYDLSGNVNYIGYTADGILIPNINVNENKMVNPKLVAIDDYKDPSKPYPGSARPFKTKYTDPFGI